MKKLLSLAFLVSFATIPLHAQQAAPKPAASKSSSPSPVASPAARSLAMPVEAKPSTPVSARPRATTSEGAPKARANNWEVYPAEHMPPGKSVSEADAAQLPPGDYSEKTVYLVGNFFVHIAEKNRAILWTSNKPGPVHIVASFPLSIPTPAEGSTIARETPRGLRITRIKRSTEDEVTIYVRDITLP